MKLDQSPNLAGPAANEAAKTWVPNRGSWLHRRRVHFRRWRRTRPFWAGVLTIIGGLMIMAGPLAAIKVILVAGQTVWVGILIGVMIWVLGLFFWFAPSQRQLTGVLAVILACVSFITSDFGGFILGMLLAMIGGAKAFAWVPSKLAYKKQKHTAMPPDVGASQSLPASSSHPVGS
ncbi:MAG: DUF6114 domain-containing protein [Candidatus Dormiibacterota bacterium]